MYHQEARSLSFVTTVANSFFWFIDLAAYLYFLGSGRLSATIGGSSPALIHVAFFGGTFLHLGHICYLLNKPLLPAIPLWILTICYNIAISVYWILIYKVLLLII